MCGLKKKESCHIYYYNKRKAQYTVIYLTYLQFPTFLLLQQGLYEAFSCYKVWEYEYMNKMALSNLPITLWCKLFWNTQRATQLIKKFLAAMDHYWVHKTSPLDPMLSQLLPFYISMSHFSKIYCTPSPSLSWVLPTWIQFNSVLKVGIVFK
jgi:hypothetical protein